MRRWLLLLLCGAVVMGSVSCAPAQEQQDHYYVYFLESDLENADGDALRRVPVSLEKGEKPGRIARDLLALLLAGPEEETLKSVIPAGTTLLSFTLNGEQANVDLSSSYTTLSGISLALADYSITLTLTQLPEISSVKITVRGKELSYRERQVFTARDVLIAPREDVINVVPAQLYFLNSYGILVAEERNINLYEGDTQAGAVIRTLEEGPESRDLSPAFPEGFSVRSVWMEEDVCYVNLSSAMLESMEDSHSVTLAMTAIQYSLYSLDSVQEVRFLVNGEFADFSGSSVPEKREAKTTA